MIHPFLYYNERSNFDKILNMKFNKQLGGCFKRNPFLKADQTEESTENYKNEDYNIKTKNIDYSNQKNIRKVLSMHDPSNITSYFSYYPLR